jgi:hypothetical protein
MVINSCVLQNPDEWYFSVKAECSDKYFSAQCIHIWALKDRLLSLQELFWTLSVHLTVPPILSMAEEDRVE